MRVDLPHFEEPPINEVAMGVTFPPIQGLRLTHFGLFWSSLRGEFGKSEEAVPLGLFEDLAMSMAGGPLPRTWLIHNDEQYLIQLQPNIFYFNWRRKGEAQNYPRYSTIKPLFYEYLKRYFEFLAQEKLPVPEVVDCNLTYVNMIPEGQDGESRKGFSDLFPDINWRHATDRFLPMPKALNWQATFDLPDDIGDLTAKVQNAKRVSDGLPVIRFEINVRSSGTDLSLDETEHWFDLAHQGIVTSFVDLTNVETQREIWKRIDATN